VNQALPSLHGRLPEITLTVPVIYHVKAGKKEKKKERFKYVVAGCRVRMYGSSQTGFGLRSSNLNLDLQICKEDKPHLALIQALDLIKDSNKFK